MKNFTPLQITALVVLSVVVVALAVVAFATANSLANEPVDIQTAQATPEVVEIKLAGDTNTPSPAPIPMPTATLTPAPSVSPTATAKPAPTKTGDSFCTLTIGKTDIPVRYGVEEETLKKSPGFLPSSALPGTEGTCAIYGHRNRNHFKVLKDAAVGDSIKVTMADGATYAYSITDITIYEKTSDWTLPASTGKTLVLVTCHPFRYSGNAPGKFVCVAIMP